MIFTFREYRNQQKTFLKRLQTRAIQFLKTCPATLKRTYPKPFKTSTFKFRKTVYKVSNLTLRKMNLDLRSCQILNVSNKLLGQSLYWQIILILFHEQVFDWSSVTTNKVSGYKSF